MRLFWGKAYNDKAVRIGANVVKIEKHPQRSGAARKTAEKPELSTENSGSGGMEKQEELTVKCSTSKVRTAGCSLGLATEWSVGTRARAGSGTHTAETG